MRDFGVDTDTCETLSNPSGSRTWDAFDEAAIDFFDEAVTDFVSSFLISLLA